MTRKYHILVVDDEPNVLTTYRLILQQQGYEVSVARTSAEALEILARSQIDLLLCDLSLEKHEAGFDVISHARRIDPKMHTVLLTGYATQEVIERAAARDIPVLLKPINVPELLIEIDRYLQSYDPASGS